MKITVIVGAIAILILALLYFAIPQEAQDTSTAIDAHDSENVRIGDESSTGSKPDTTGKLRADTFTGTLEKVDTGCFFDGECFVEVDGKHVTVLMGWSRDTVGRVQGADGIGGLESHIGQEVEVYAQDNADGTYTLYGSEGFYIQAK